ncbi:MAG: UDP-N-acetylmuramoyl-L-alanyl-D-glutamate--2,6-diaminopimelate ligase [Candidatus Yanofskybacteria bacterium]|nr:UDP-N-acetylmuramoyl-L-alanyl-D-glutamate--2,6-diaminopimelate ligase [Candidatus Yanofskybacteria bacterium]
MFQENRLLNKLLGLGRAVLPRRIFKLAQPVYHWGLVMLGAAIYGFPSQAMRVIAVTGTKGKSTTVYMISKIFEEQGLSVAAVGSLGFKIKERTWPNTLKMTLPGRLKLQKFLYQAKKAGCRYVVLEATSEGIVQNRLAGVKIDCAVFTNLHREHLESHGSFENYMAAKQKLFLKTGNIHVLNIDDPYFEKFANFTAQHKVTYGKKWGMITSEKLKTKNEKLNLKLLGDFNEYNALAALAVAHAYNLDMNKAVASLNSIKSIPGRMEIIHAPKGFNVIIDYAHTPDSLELVYKTLRNQPHISVEVEPRNKLICVLGAAGGGRDKWKRPEFGKIAAKYCNEVILTNEDPYDENPEAILEQIASGFSQTENYTKILDRKEAIRKALVLAQVDDIVVITGKGSENLMAVAGGKKISWSDKEIVLELLS